MGTWCSWLSRSLSMREVSGSIPDVSIRQQWLKFCISNLDGVNLLCTTQNTTSPMSLDDLDIARAGPVPREKLKEELSRLLGKAIS